MRDSSLAMVMMFESCLLSFVALSLRVCSRYHWSPKDAALFPTAPPLLTFLPMRS